jgi:hypothetical protein
MPHEGKKATVDKQILALTLKLVSTAICICVLCKLSDSLKFEAIPIGVLDCGVRSETLFE